MNKITNSQIKGFVRLKLATDPLWATTALMKIFEFQTIEEKKYNETVCYNGVGFTGTDGRILTSFAKQFKKYGRLSERQMSILFKKMPKYWQQIIKISDKEKLHSLVQLQTN